MTDEPTNPLSPERDFYLSIKDRLTAEHQGKYVLIKNQEEHGIFSNFQDAHTHSIQTFGPGIPVLIQKITSEENINFHAALITG